MLDIDPHDASSIAHETEHALEKVAEANEMMERTQGAQTFQDTALGSKNKNQREVRSVALLLNIDEGKSSQNK